MTSVECHIKLCENWLGQEKGRAAMFRQGNNRGRVPNCTIFSIQCTTSDQNPQGSHQKQCIIQGIGCYLGCNQRGGWIWILARILLLLSLSVSNNCHFHQHRKIRLSQIHSESPRPLCVSVLFGQVQDLMFMVYYIFSSQLQASDQSFEQCTYHGDLCHVTFVILMTTNRDESIFRLQLGHYPKCALK